ncbi:hypothetical protein RhiirC2_795257 [Rhizophagus irregularis]|uniref:Uncharacterized protein n=1 Tax=Rhizophagus irregularis TaxID=588596 RepID=A0A2N1MBX7_9GLOM|nr:hypothetical protein RhiirC2_795257 [Rhizophagus irregularis]
MRSKEEHEELDLLNNNFSERLDEERDSKKKIEDEDEINKNKKRLVTTQGQREDSVKE